MAAPTAYLAGVAHTSQIMKLDLEGQVLGMIAGAGQGYRQIRRGGLDRREPARREFRSRHAELARAEVCEGVGGKQSYGLSTEFDTVLRGALTVFRPSSTKHFSQSTRCAGL